MVQKIDLDINKLDWLAIARVVAPILAPIVLAGAWVFLARTNKKANYLSGIFALLEMVPSIELNLPSGIVLGSFYNSASLVQDKLEKYSIEDMSDALSELIFKEEELTPTQESFAGTVKGFWDWLTELEIPKDAKFGPGKGLA